MAVSLDFTFPDQPAGNGSSVYRPLAGNGFTSPHSLFTANGQLAMDVSGTTAIVTINFDVRFSSICVLAQGLITGLTGAKEYECELVTDQPAGGKHRARAFGTGITTDTLTDDCFFSWSPPLIMFGESISMKVVNTDSGVLNFLVWVYNYAIDAPHRVPLSVLLASVPSIEGQNVSL